MHGSRSARRDAKVDSRQTLAGRLPGGGRFCAPVDQSAALWSTHSKVVYDDVLRVSIYIIAGKKGRLGQVVTRDSGESEGLRNGRRKEERKEG
jgi:hypothetical protein